jgi:hypothetical protein
MITRTRNRNDYDALIAELQIVERTADAVRRQLGLTNDFSGTCLTDENIDAENVLVDGVTVNSPEYWPNMYYAACMAAGYRAEELGLSINQILGHDIY